MNLTDQPDPYRWLEDVQGARALQWVQAHNARTEQVLQATPGFDALRDSLREVLDSRAQIPYVSRRGDWLYNLWRDADHPRGLWRRTTLAEYRRPEPAWETVIDVDALGRAEGENWVWGGATCLGPSYRRCLVALSRGGADARVVREFDTVDKRFVVGGFALPEAKSQLEWIDADHVYVGTDFGPGSMTASGYPRLIKRWTRGQPLAGAETVFEARPDDVYAYASVDATPGHERTVFGRAIDFYTVQLSLLQGDRLVPIDKPPDAKLSFQRDLVLIELRSSWTVGGRTWPGGSLLVGDAAAWLRGERRLTALFTPTPTRSLADYSVTGRAVLLDVLDNVASRVEEWTRAAAPAGDAADAADTADVADAAWQRREVRAPYPGHITVTALYDPLLKADPLAEDYLLNVADFLSPDSLQLGRAGSDLRQTLKSRPGFFDAAGLRVEQRFARSKDGTRVPYFVIWPKGAKADGDNPTLLYGYGGFEVSMTPFYSGIVGRAWTTRGGVYVLANIRGGGEFGPAWHQAAVKANKQHSFDDFEAVAEDLIATRVTRPARLGIEGGSN
ncbi:MAG: S9 family peptidase, partial [Burkholderiales bacterium]|nr:S9 family peptidase [Burkholderiales bacterium]